MGQRLGAESAAATALEMFGEGVVVFAEGVAAAGQLLGVVGERKGFVGVWLRGVLSLHNQLSFLLTKGFGNFWISNVSTLLSNHLIPVYFCSSESNRKRA